MSGGLPTRPRRPGRFDAATTVLAVSQETVEERILGSRLPEALQTGDDHELFARAREGDVEEPRQVGILSLVQEALSQLRLDMKYLVFDLEATRRERDAYKQSLEGENSD